MEEKTEKRICHKEMAAKRREQVLMIVCMDYLIRHIRNHGEYNFKNAWDSTSELGTTSKFILRRVNDKELDEAIGPIADDEAFEDIIRVGVQSLAHACYLKDWEDKMGAYLHPQKNVFGSRDENQGL